MMDSSNDFYYWSTEENDGVVYGQPDISDAIKELKNRGFIPVLEGYIKNPRWQVLVMDWDLTGQVREKIGITATGSPVLSYFRAIKEELNGGLLPDSEYIGKMFFKVEKDIWIEEFNLGVVCLSSKEFMLLADENFPEAVRYITSDITEKLTEAIVAFLGKHKAIPTADNLEITRTFKTWLLNQSPDPTTSTTDTAGAQKTGNPATNQALVFEYTDDDTSDKDLADLLALDPEDLGKVTTDKDDSQTSATTLGMEDFSGGLGEDGSDSGSDCFPL